MPYTTPNQKILHIHRAPLNNNFLGINNDNWKVAARSLGAHAFLLYIYFASNKDDYRFAASPAAIAQEIGMPRSTYHDQFRKLESMGYLVKGKGNLYHFYEVPQSAAQTEDVCLPLNSCKEQITTGEKDSPHSTPENTAKNIEIYNKRPNGLTNTPIGVENSSRHKVKDCRKTEDHFVF